MNTCAGRKQAVRSQPGLVAGLRCSTLVLALIGAVSWHGAPAVWGSAEAQRSALPGASGEHPAVTRKDWDEIPCTKAGRLALARGSVHFVQSIDSLTIYGAFEDSYAWEQGLAPEGPLAQPTVAERGTTRLQATVEFGRACRSAEDKPACLALLETVGARHRTWQGARAFAVVTSNNQVRVIDRFRDLLRALVRPISTNDEAVVLAAFGGLPMTCRKDFLAGTEVRHLDGHFEVRSRARAPEYDWIIVQSTGELGKLHLVPPRKCDPFAICIQDEY